MAEFVRIFAIANVAQVQLAFNAALTAADRLVVLEARTGVRGGAAARAELLRTYARFSRDLDDAAKLGAREATAAIIAKIEETRLRPETDKRKHLRDLIESRPANLGLRGLATGAVGVADVAVLNLAIDPDYPRGTYWEAQEYGTTAHLGREITGFFHGGGAPGRPLAQFSGGGAMHKNLSPSFSPSAKFTPAAGPGSRGGRPGKGTIRVPLKPRRFIRDGADSARLPWKAAVLSAQDSAVSRLSNVKPGPLRGRR